MKHLFLGSPRSASNNATLNQTLGDCTLVATAVVTPAIHASLTVTLDNCTLVATASVSDRNASLTVTLDDCTLVATAKTVPVDGLVTQSVLEVFGRTASADAVVTQTYVEVFGQSASAKACVTQTVLEVFGRPKEFRFDADPAIALTWVEFLDSALEMHVWSDVALPDP